MRTYKKIKKKVEDKVYCDVCGQNCTVDQLGSEYATLEAIWGYSSTRDGQKFDIQICEQCFVDILYWIKNKRKQVLGCFQYPYDKDPLDGQSYNIL